VTRPIPGLALLGLVLSVSACRGQISEAPPVHIIPDMDWQPRYEPQEASDFFEDGRAMRPLVQGTVARGAAVIDQTGFSTGRLGGQPLQRAPIEVDERTLSRGQQRYNIYCAACHDQTGSGNGLVVQRGYPRPVDLSGESTRALSDGEVFEVISNGIRNMPAYGHQIAIQDRWAIVSWVRVLQRSQHATIDDVPPQDRGRIEPETAQ
jgi:mono/diheme cytochrome c family protein